MSPPKRPPLPVILLANDLLDGEVVFWTGADWSPVLAAARIAQDENAASALEEAAQQGLGVQKVVDAYLVDVRLDAQGHAAPRHYREKIKTLGPTTRRDLGKQARPLNTPGAGI